jgi:hypothetical protein
MNSKIKRAAVALSVFSAMTASGSSADRIVFGKSVTPADRQCLADMLRHGDWRLSPELHQEMIGAAVVARPDLKGNGLKQYIFVVTNSCGTAGCSMLIGDIGGNGACREIYSGSGFDEILTGSGLKPGMTVLRKRDHGYRRLYTPCELRFDGREYRQIHDECPNINVQR